MRAFCSQWETSGGVYGGQKQTHSGEELNSRMYLHLGAREAAEEGAVRDAPFALLVVKGQKEFRSVNSKMSCLLMPNTYQHKQRVSMRERPGLVLQDNPYQANVL